MANHQDIVEKLSQFNNVSFTRKQWEIVLKGCGCPKSHHFWAALKANNLQKDRRVLTLIDIDTESFEKIWTLYCESNRASVMKTYQKKRAREKAQARRESFKGVTLYLVNGCLTDIKPTRDEY